MRLYNSLTRKVEEFGPRQGKRVGMYTCGPTVYDTAHIGNFRTYTVADILARTLEYLGYDLTYVMNLTDVGHLTGDNEGDPDRGEDRLEKGARREGLSAWEIAERYGQEFREHMKWLNFRQPDYLVKATEHIEEQISLVKELERRGLTYRTSEGIYFDVQKFEGMGYRYGELSTLDQRKGGARVEWNSEKKDVRDFALWKFSPKDKKRQMEWESPWGKGFPGWHIECSAMSMKYLGSQFEIHVGGEDLRSTHHPNEIAQAEGATGKHPFVKYWLHVAFLLVEGGRMGKSLGNAYTLSDVRERGFEPLAMRYFYLTGHYRKQQNFTWEALAAAEKALKRLRRVFREINQVEKPEDLSYRKRFKEAMGNDLNTPEALAVVWEMVRDENLRPEEKKWLLKDFERVLGLDLGKKEEVVVPEKVRQLAEKRWQLKQKGEYKKADELRERIREMGYEVRDGEDEWELEYSM